MRIVAVIPARYKSTRFQGKPLVKIGGVPMIQRVYNQVQKVNLFTDIIVATDDHRIYNFVRSIGGHSQLTSDTHQSGTDRIWEVVQNLDIDGVINIQGDEPLIPAKLIEDMYHTLSTMKYEVVTPVFVNTNQDEYSCKNNVKVVIDKDNFALFFSRSPIPHFIGSPFSFFYHHIGTYGYVKSCLKKFIELPVSDLEKIERLEQLRFLENGIRIYTIKTAYKSIGVDVPEDVMKVEGLLKPSD